MIFITRPLCCKSVILYSLEMVTMQNNGSFLILHVRKSSLNSGTESWIQSTGKGIWKFLIGPKYLGGKQKVVVSNSGRDQKDDTNRKGIVDNQEGKYKWK